MKTPLALILFLPFTLWLSAAEPGTPTGFRAGAATADVTAPLGSSINGGFQDGKAAYIHDHQLARCLALEEGKTRVVLVVVDSCVIGREVFDEAKQLVHEATGTPMENLLFSATHSHSCGTMQAVGQSEPDPLYQRFVARRIADGVRCAIQNLEPSQIAWGTGSVPHQVFNRRWRMKEGGIPTTPLGVTTDRVRTNPGINHPLLDEPAGPIDPEVPFLSVRALDGRPIALYANYSLHYVGGVGPGHISADYFGAFADRIQEKLQADRQVPPFVGMISNGASGDINNVDFRGGQAKEKPYGRIGIVANEVASEVSRVHETLTWQHEATLAVVQREITLGLRLPDAVEVEKAREVMKGSKLFPRMETSEQVYARETVLLADFPKEVSVPLQVVKIGSIQLAAIPAEVFVEIGLELKQRFPGTIVVSLANAYHGYLPTPEHHALGGYETWRARSSYLEVEASRKIVTALAEMLTEAGVVAQKQ